MHKFCNEAVEDLLVVLKHADDFRGVLAVGYRSLATLVQLQGLDSLDAYESHLMLSATCSELGLSGFAIQHLVAAKYILCLCCGPRHPGLINIFSRLARQYGELGEFPVAVKCLEEAMMIAELGDQEVVASLAENLGNIHSAATNYKAAVACFLTSYKLVVQLSGPQSKAAQEVKALHEKAFRNLTEQNVAAAKAKQVADAQEKEQKLVDSWLQDEEPTGGDAAKKKGKSKGGKKK